MLDILMTIIAFIIFAILIMSMITMMCIYIAIKRGEDVHSDAVRDKYVEVATAISILIVLIVVAFNY